MSAGTLFDVALLEVPVALWAQALEHYDELFREFALLTAQVAEDEHTTVPVRLTQLVAALSAEYGPTTTEQEARLSAASTAGIQELPVLTFQVPAQTADAVVALGALLDEADDYCRAGQDLLTLATPDELVRFRNWYLEEFVRQIGGEPPRPWSQYAA